MKQGFDGLARINPALALELAGQLTAPFQRSVAFSSIGEERARREPQAAYEWAKNIMDPAERESALRGVFRSWAETDPQGVAAKLGELSGDVNDAKGESPVKNIVRAWAAIDPKAALDFAREHSLAANTNWKDLLRQEILPARDDWSAVNWRRCCSIKIIDRCRKTAEITSPLFPP